MYVLSVNMIGFVLSVSLVSMLTLALIFPVVFMILFVMTIILLPLTIPGPIAFRILLGYFITMLH